MITYEIIDEIIFDIEDMVSLIVHRDIYNKNKGNAGSLYIYGAIYPLDGASQIHSIILTSYYPHIV